MAFIEIKPVIAGLIAKGNAEKYSAEKAYGHKQKTIIFEALINEIKKAMQE